MSEVLEGFLQVGAIMFREMKLGLTIPSQERLDAVPVITKFLASAPGLPLIADTTDYSQPLPKGLWGYLGNNKFGNCFWVTIANILMSQQLNAGMPVKVFTEADVMGWYKAYLASTGVIFNESDPNTDQGTDPILGMQFAQDMGLFTSWGQVPINGNDDHLAGATNLFGGIILGVKVPSGWMSSTTWGPNAGAIEGGHAIGGMGYNENLDMPCETWRQIVKLLSAGKAQYGQCAFAFVSDAWKQSKGASLQGFDETSLQRLLVQVR